MMPTLGDYIRIKHGYAFKGDYITTEDALRQGKYAFFACQHKHDFQMVDVSTPVVDSSVPAYIFMLIPASFYTKVEISEYQRGRLYFNQKFESVLEPGTL